MDKQVSQMHSSAKDLSCSGKQMVQKILNSIICEYYVKIIWGDLTNHCFHFEFQLGKFDTIEVETFSLVAQCKTQEQTGNCDHFVIVSREVRCD